MKTKPHKFPLIIGHRGASAEAPENTLTAFARAFADGADGIELDVRLAKDGVPVVIHDATLRRTGPGRDSVRDKTSRELARADAGTWFNLSNPSRAHPEYASEGVPSLADVFDLVRKVRRSPRGVIYVEIKTDGTKDITALTASVAQLIRQAKFHQRVVVVSFDHAVLIEIKKLDSAMRTGALFSPRHGGGKVLRTGAITGAALDCGADEILLHRLLARPKLVNDCTNRNLPVVVWTVDGPAWIRRAQDLGIHALITNAPAVFRKPPGRR